MVLRDASKIFERFISKIEVAQDGCWYWQGKLNQDGYGRLSVDGKMVKAHRVSYVLFGGELVEKLVLDHVCVHRNCVNFSHLEQVSNQENIHRIYHRHDDIEGRTI